MKDKGVAYIMHPLVKSRRLKKKINVTNFCKDTNPTVRATEGQGRPLVQSSGTLSNELVVQVTSLKTITMISYHNLSLSIPELRILSHLITCF